LLPYNQLSEVTENGITFTPVYEGDNLLYVKAKGTATATVTYRFYGTDTTTPQKVFDSATKISFGLNGSSSTYGMVVWGLNSSGGNIGAVIYSETDYATGFQLAGIGLRIISGANVDIQFKPMIRLASITDGTYEPYTGGIPSPSPAFPQDIHVVKGNNTITVSDNNNNGTTYPINLPVQNLFDKDNANLLKAYINTTANTIQTYGVTGADFKLLYISCSPNTTYTISKISSQRFSVAETQTTPAGGVTVSNKIFNNTGTSITITTSADAKYLVVFYYLSSADTLTEQQILDTIQIEPGDKSNRYTPYGVAPIELCKIGNYQDKIFKAITGDTIYDTLTSEQKEGLISGGWYKYEYIKRYILNGSENWDNTYGTNVFHIDITGKKVNSSSLALTNCYVFDDRQYGYSANLPNGKFAIQITQSATVDALFIKNTNYDNPTNFKNSLVNNNLYLYYPLATPTITQITDSTLISQLEALYNAMSYNGQTNILQTNADLPFIISASALKGA
jgi:hypothetical protein